MGDYERFFELLDDREEKTRLNAVRSLKEMADAGKLEIPAACRDTNNHIHTKFSFSPYYPAKAVWMAYAAGLETAGIVDHDSVAGVPEFLEAAEILRFPVSTGFEVRADLSGTPMGEIRVNNPDQPGNAYITLQGLPHDKIRYINGVLAPYREQRLKRTEKMAEGIASLVAPYGISYDFEKDVLPLTLFYQGGTITERYLLYALANKLIFRLGMGENLVRYLKDELKMNVSEKAAAMLSDPHNPHYIYDLLGLCKAEFLDKVFVPGGGDCPKVTDMAGLAADTGAVLTYCYLGDQGDSATGDKKAMKFEDDRLEEIILSFKDMGFSAGAYLPSRNTTAQIVRLKEVCRKYEMFEICGEDINQPRQKFVCEKMRDPLYADAYDNTFALIGHEIAVSEKGKAAGMPADASPFEEKIRKFAEIGKKAYGKK
jgi:hypothetical protein